MTKTKAAILLQAAAKASKAGARRSFARIAREPRLNTWVSSPRPSPPDRQQRARWGRARRDSTQVRPEFLAETRRDANLAGPPHHNAPGKRYTMATLTLLRPCGARLDHAHSDYVSAAVAKYREKAARAFDLARATRNRGNYPLALGLLDEAEAFRAMANGLESQHTIGAST